MSAKFKHTNTHSQTQNLGIGTIAWTANDDEGRLRIDTIAQRARESGLDFFDTAERETPPGSPPPLITTFVSFHPPPRDVTPSSSPTNRVLLLLRTPPMEILRPDDT